MSQSTVIGWPEIDDLHDVLVVQARRGPYLDWHAADEVSIVHVARVNDFQSEAPWTMA